MHLDFRVKLENDKKDTFGTSPFILLVMGFLETFIAIYVSKALLRKVQKKTLRNKQTQK